MPKVSIIIPVYNASATLRRMMDSLIAQTYTDWEIVAVDDGSTDGSGEILDTYAFSDHRINVIHKVNGGVAAARQDGIDNATGTYTIHADSDDWVAPDMLKDMITVAEEENADIVIADFYVDSPGKAAAQNIQRPEDCDPREVLYGLYAKGLFGGLWHKLIKKSVYAKAGAHFYPGINYCEDLLLLTQILSLSMPKISYLPKAYYHYVLDGPSLTRNVTQKGLASMRRFHEEASRLLPTEDRYTEIRKSFARDEFLVYFTNRLYSDRKDLSEAYQKVKPLLLRGSGPRWKLGFKCIENGLTNLAHRLIKM